jgi:hypothetical protein
MTATFALAGDGNVSAEQILNAAAHARTFHRRTRRADRS